MKQTRAILTLTMSLWLLSGLTAVAQALAQVEVATKLTDVVVGKDLPWLQNFTTILAILFSAWVVKQLINQWNRATDAILSLRDELSKLPCPFRDHDNR